MAHEGTTPAAGLSLTPSPLKRLRSKSRLFVLDDGTVATASVVSSTGGLRASAVMPPAGLDAGDANSSDERGGGSSSSSSSSSLEELAGEPGEGSGTPSASSATEPELEASDGDDSEPLRGTTPEVLAAAHQLRALLPRMWHHFKPDVRAAANANGSSGSNARIRASTSLGHLRSWMVRRSQAGAQWSEVPRSELLRVLTAASHLPPLHQRLGFRFQDPTKSGSWGAANLIGYAEKHTGLKRKGSDISWDNYEATFTLRVSQVSGTVEVVRSTRRKPIVARVEKRRRGDPNGALHEERVHFAVTAASRRKQASDGRKRIQVQRRNLDLLPAVVFQSPSGPQQWTMIYLHGLGSSALGNYADRPHYFFDGSIQLKVVVPTAPSREVSCFDGWWHKHPTGWKLTKFLSWYDYLSNHDGAREDSIDWESLGAVQQALHHLIEKEAGELGGRTHRVILGGKSQGCCTSLDAALTYPKPLGGFIGIVGHLLSCTPVEADGPQSSTPLHFFHEPEDRMMRWEWVSKGEKRMRDAGYRVRSRRVPDPENNGHFVDGVEGAWIRNALRSICNTSDVLSSSGIEE